jgi:hypothetical protein
LEKLPVSTSNSIEIPYVAPLLGNIRPHLTGLQGFETMALELIQNADDAGASTVRFDVRDDCLCMTNDARFSSCGLQSAECDWQRTGGPNGKRKACDFHAISMVGSGNKYRDPSLIGRFGIGFVSVYQVTDSPVIRSGTTELRLDPYHARNAVNQIVERPGTEFQLPWAFDPESPTRDALHASPISPQDIEQAYADFDRVSRTCLLFLRNLRCVEVARGGEVKVRVTRRPLDENRIKLRFEPSSDEQVWYVLRTVASKSAAELKHKFPQLEKLGRQATIQIAFPVDLSQPITGRLFAFLPTEQQAPLPCHINADFFPEQDRKALVLSGEQHERHWNQMLLNAAANEIAANLIGLRDVLGAQGLWGILSAAFDKKSSEHFGRYWSAIEEIAKDAEIVLTASGRWAKPEDVLIPARDTDPKEEQALVRIGLELVDPELRPFLNTLQALGSRQLNLGLLVEAFEKWDRTFLDEELARGEAVISQVIQPICSILNRLLKDAGKTPTTAALVTRLSAVRLAPQWGSGLSRIVDLYRLPLGVANERVFEFLPNVALVSRDFEIHQALYEKIEYLDLETLLGEIASTLVLEGAEGLLGVEPGHLRRFYTFLAAYPREGATDTGAVDDVAFLRGNGKFLTPNEAVLPGGFKDPLGRFEILDASLYDDLARGFLRDVLGVEVLDLQTYLRTYLKRVLEDGLSSDEHAALLAELVRHPEVLDDHGLRDTLADLPLVRTSAGTMARPRDCYLKTAELAAAVGDTPSLWVDTSAFKNSNWVGLREFLGRLGMRTRPSLEHVVKRIEQLVSAPPDDDRRALVGTALHHVAEICEDEGLTTRVSPFMGPIARLRTMKWIPATKGGNPLPAWHAPSEVFQHFRASGFASQVPILSVEGRLRTSLTGTFLEFLGMPAEPSTKVVVDHLVWCSENDVEPNTVVYQILNERVRSKNDVQAILALRGVACVYGGSLKRFIRPDRIFWSKPSGLWDHCFQAPSSAHQFREFFELIGVQEEPTLMTYADVLVELADMHGASPDPLHPHSQLVHVSCLRALGNGYATDPAQVDALLEDLQGHPCILTMAGTLAFPDEVAVVDNAWLAEPFGSDIDARLVKPHPETRELLERLGCAKLSSVTRVEAAHIGEVIADEAATDLLRDRQRLLLWLFSDLRADAQHRIADALERTRVFRSDAIKVYSVFSLDDPPITSSTRGEDVLYDEVKGTLHAQVDIKGSLWIPALRAIFSTLLAEEGDINVRQCAFAASQILHAPSAEEAKEQLEQAGYTAPASHPDPYPADDASPWMGNIGTDEDGQEETSSAAVTSGDITSSDLVQGSDGSSETSSSISPVSTYRTGADGTPINIPDGVTAKEGESQVANGAPKPDPTPAKPADTPKARNRREEWMRSYVVPANGATKGSQQKGPSQDRINAIDAAAMQAVLDYESAAGRSPERKPHLNPGYDISSTSKDGARRIIEVKGIDGAWTERGVKLSRTQIGCARDTGNDYWLYVVENALETPKRVIHAIQDPYNKASEFWFDDVWREVADERGDLKSRFVKGRDIIVQGFGQGRIIEVKTIGFSSELVVEFPILGRRSLALDLSRMNIIGD